MDVRVESESMFFLANAKFLTTARSDGSGYGRSPADVTERLDRIIEDIRTRYHDKAIGKPKGEASISDVLLVAHGHILRAFAMRWIGRELTQGVSLLLEGTLFPPSGR